MSIKLITTYALFRALLKYDFNVIIISTSIQYM